MKTVTQAIADQLPKPLPHWRLVLKRAWSIRFNAIAILLSGLEIAVPYFDGVFPIPRGVFGGLAGLISAAALYARIVQQENLKGTGQ